MSDTIGRIPVPTVINSGQTFPLTTQYPFGFSVERPVILHRFGSLDAKQEQRYYVGIGPRKFQFKHPNLNWTESNEFKSFWVSMQRRHAFFGAEGLSKVACLVFQMQSTVGIESNAAQPLYLNRPVTVGDVKGYVQAAPNGSGVTFTIYVGTTA